jgi:hypothetical protein
MILSHQDKNKARPKGKKTFWNLFCFVLFFSRRMVCIRISILAACCWMVVNAGWFGGKKKGPREDSGAFKHIGPQRALGVSAFSLALEVIPLYNFTRNPVCQYCIRAFDFILTYGPTSIFLAFSAVSLSFYVRVCAFEKARASITPKIHPLIY